MQEAVWSLEQSKIIVRTSSLEQQLTQIDFSDQLSDCFVSPTAPLVAITTDSALLIVDLLRGSLLQSIAAVYTKKICHCLNSELFVCYTAQHRKPGAVLVGSLTYSDFTPRTMYFASPVTAAIPIAECSRILIGSRDGMLQALDFETLAQLFAIPLEFIPTSIVHIKGTTIIAVAGYSSKVAFIDCLSGELLFLDDRKTAHVTALQGSSTSSLISWGLANREIFVFDIKSMPAPVILDSLKISNYEKECGPGISLFRGVGSLSWGPNNYFAASMDDRMIYFWNSDFNTIGSAITMDTCMNLYHAKDGKRLIAQNLEQLVVIDLTDYSVGHSIKNDHSTIRKSGWCNNFWA